MKIGDQLDPIAIGHNAIDVKGILLSFGYALPQGSSAKLPLLPGEVQAEIAKQKESQEQYETLEETKAFYCPHCGTHNSGAWKKEVFIGDEFLVCGDCHKVTEVR